MNRYKSTGGCSRHLGSVLLDLARSTRRDRSGFTLIELLVVSGVSLILMTVGALVYIKCLNMYQEGQGLTEVYQTARLISRDLKTTLGYVVPFKGEWVTPQCYKFGGGDVPVAESTRPLLLSPFYFPKEGHGNHLNNTKDDPAAGPQFSGAQLLMTRPDQNPPHIGMSRNTWSVDFVASSWKRMSGDLVNGYHAPYYQNGCWWPPGFFGKRDGGVAVNLENFDNQVGSWGWPRPDYRMDADADDIKNKKVISNWFYCEDREFNSPHSYALDNPNIVLASIKFSAWAKDGFDYTQLSLLKHHISGWDHSGKVGSLLRSDMTYGNMLRAIKIVAYHLDNGDLVKMDDAALGVEEKDGKTIVDAAATKMPRCFDAVYRLRNPKSQRDYVFVRRFFCLSSPQ